MESRPARVLDLGLMAYRDAWEKQLEIAEQVACGAPDTLVFVEHPSVYTLGANFHESNLMYPPEFYRDKGVDIVKTDRGGDITYHGPNQLVIYPIFDLKRHKQDLHWWLRGLEQTVIEVVAEFGLSGARFPPNTGVWVDSKKVAAIGIKIKKWINIHGIAINCNNDLAPFSWIVPCGIQGYGVTSLSIETGKDLSTESVKPSVLRSFESVFGSDF